MANTIASSAKVDKQAELGDNITIENFCYIGPEVKINDNTVIKHNSVITGDTELGKNCVFFQNTVIGEVPQDLKFNNEKTKLVIGNNNTVREFVTISRGTGHGGGVTRIGNNNLFMAYCHVAHDCQIGSNNVFANAATLAGHVEVEDNTIIGGLTAIHQFSQIGKHSIIGGMSRIPKDILPFAKVAGHPLKIMGINKIGLERNNFSPERRADIQKAFKIIFKDHNNVSQALDILKNTKFEYNDDIEHIINFIEKSKRGIAK